VIASDVNQTRLDLARQMGAHDAVTPDEVELKVRLATEDLGVDVVLEMSGVPRRNPSGVQARQSGRKNSDARHSEQAD
jgi:threonine dehydrogenase-like Zn-dependent dehydrogenase